MRGSGACSCPGPRSEAFLSRTQSGMPGPGRLALRQHRAAGRCVQVLCMEDSAPHSESGAGCDRADSLRERQPSGVGAQGELAARRRLLTAQGMSVQRRLLAAELRQVMTALPTEPTRCAVPAPETGPGPPGGAHTQLSGMHSASSSSSGQGAPWLAGCTRM